MIKKHNFVFSYNNDNNHDLLESDKALFAKVKYDGHALLDGINYITVNEAFTRGFPGTFIAVINDNFSGQAGSSDGITMIYKKNSILLARDSFYPYERDFPIHEFDLITAGRTYKVTLGKKMKDIESSGYKIVLFAVEYV